MTTFHNNIGDALHRVQSGDRLLVKATISHSGGSSELRGVAYVHQTLNSKGVLLNVGMGNNIFLGEYRNGQWDGVKEEITALERFSAVDGKTLDKFPSPIGTYEITMSAAVVDTIQVEARDVKQAEKLAGKAFYAKHGTAPTTYTIYDRPGDSE